MLLPLLIEDTENDNHQKPQAITPANQIVFEKSIITKSEQNLLYKGIWRITIDQENK